MDESGSLYGIGPIGYIFRLVIEITSVPKQVVQACPFSVKIDNTERVTFEKCAFMKSLSDQAVISYREVHVCDRIQSVEFTRFDGITYFRFTRILLRNNIVFDRTVEITIVV